MKFVCGHNLSHLLNLKGTDAPKMADPPSASDQPLIDMLDHLRASLTDNTLPWKERLLLVEMNVKRSLLSGKSVPMEENDCLKYMFLGAYLYNFVIPRAPVEDDNK